MYNEYNNGYRYNNRYVYSGKNRSNSAVDDEIISLATAIEYIKDAIQDEEKDALFYDNLISIAPDENSKNIISSIKGDEKRHNEILRFVYSNITNETLELPQEEITIDEMTYTSSIDKALLDEIEAVKKYRKILGAMPNSKLYTLIMSILTDEIRHASLYNYLICKNMQNNKNMKV